MAAIDDPCPNTADGFHDVIRLKDPVSTPYGKNMLYFQCRACDLVFYGIKG